jgi:hypothetical protein
MARKTKEQKEAERIARETEELEYVRGEITRITQEVSLQNMLKKVGAKFDFDEMEFFWKSADGGWRRTMPMEAPKIDQWLIAKYHDDLRNLRQDYDDIIFAETRTQRLLNLQDRLQQLMSDEERQEFTISVNIK